MRLFLRRLATLTSLASLYLLPVHAQSWDSLLATIRRRFPSVRQISTGDLSRWLAETNRPAPVILDTREPDEFATSHLPGARRATRVDDVRRLSLPPAQPIVLYCSVGWRSSALAEQLQQAGYTNVANLEGSIFAWANQGLPVFQGSNRVQLVHPYDSKWGKLLDSKWHPQTPTP